MVDLPKRSYFLFEMLKSIEIISHFSEKWNVLTTLQRILSLANKIKPLPNLFRSLRNMLYPFTWNCWSGKESSNFVSEIKKISVSLRTSYLKSKNLFLIEFILRWPIIRFLAYFRRCWGRKFTVPSLATEDWANSFYLNRFL